MAVRGPLVFVSPNNSSARLYCTAQCYVLRIEVTFVGRFFIVVSPINMHAVAASSVVVVA